MHYLCPVGRRGNYSCIVYSMRTTAVPVFCLELLPAVQLNHIAVYSCLKVKLMELLACTHTTQCNRKAPPEAEPNLGQEIINVYTR